MTPSASTPLVMIVPILYIISSVYVILIVVVVGGAADSAGTGMVPGRDWHGLCATRQSFIG